MSETKEQAQQEATTPSRSLSTKSVVLGIFIGTAVNWAALAWHFAYTNWSGGGYSVTIAVVTCVLAFGVFLTQELAQFWVDRKKKGY